MCGLVGIMGDVEHVDRTVFKELLLVDQLRGKHSTGLAAINRAGDAAVFKKAVNAMDFLDFKTFGTTLASPASCLIGHNRYATQGAVNNVNAHPFEFDGLVGAHNGTLTNYTELDDYHQFDVDSECLYNHINNNGLEDACRKISGAAALTWFDKTTNELNLYRNSERPLCYTYSEDLKTMYWASEGWMLSSILWRNNIKHTQVVYIKEDHLYTFKVPNGIMTKLDVLSAPSVRKVPKVAAKKLGGTTTMSTTMVGGTTSAKGLPSSTKRLPHPNAIASRVNEFVDVVFNSANFDQNGQSFINFHLLDEPNIEVRAYTSRDSKLYDELFGSDGVFNCKVKSYNTFKGKGYLVADLRTITLVDEEGEESNLAHITVNGYDGEKINYNQFREATSEGCCWCTGPADFGKPTLFTSKFEFYCHDCIKEPEAVAFRKGVML